MAIHVARYLHQGQIRWGVVSQERIAPVEEPSTTTANFLRTHSAASLAGLVNCGTVDLSGVRILSPITSNQQFLCQGANYRQHMIESGMDPDSKHFNMLFTKASSCIVPADSPVIRPQHVRFLDYEIELGLVLIRDITKPTLVTEANLHEFIGGVVIVNDYSARDIQIPQRQFYKGKSYRTFGPVGPYLCLLEPQEMHYLSELNLTLKVNGGVRQQDSTANLVHRPAETLTELSGVHDLFCGDLIATGTPSGCALSIPSPIKQRIGALLPEKKKWAIFMKVQEKRTQYLKPGDVVEAEIRSGDGVVHLGIQRNAVLDYR
jgi:2,4-diketo-3-deoxy-L-fuconate hydrolase